MYLNEVILKHELAVDPANTGLKSEDSLVCWYAQIDDTVVESHVLSDNRHSILTLLFSFLIRTCGPTFSFLIEYLTAGVLKLEWQDGHRLVTAPYFLDLKLNLLRTSVNRSVGNAYLGYEFDDRLTREFACKSHHAFADTLTNSKDGLNCRVRFSADNETHFALTSSVMDATPDSHFGICFRLI